MAKYCPRCKNELQIEGAPVCPSCGATLTPPPTTSPPDTISRIVRYLAVFFAALFIAYLIFSALFFIIALPKTFFPHEAPEGMQVPVYHETSLRPPGLGIQGGVIGRSRCINGSCQEINSVEFTLGLEPGGEPVDMNGVIIFLGNGSPDSPGRAYHLNNRDAEGGQWSITHIVGANLDTRLERGDKMDIALDLPESTGSIAAGDRFTLTILPGNGQPITIRSEAPDNLDSVNFLR